jgi:succinyl-diaminopimelate desuccinylase
MVMNEIELTQELVRINSENPPGNEIYVARFIKDFLEDLKIDAKIMEFEKNRCDVVASIGRGNGLMLNGHMDTVPAGDINKWKYDPFEARIAGGNVYGRGTSDMKGGIASVLAAVQKLKDEKLKGKLLLVFVADEEAGQGGSEYLLTKRKELFRGIRYGVLTDSNDLQLTIAQKGLVHMNVIFKGKAAHGSTPELGDNAIYKATEFVQELRKIIIQLDKIRNPILGRGTINVGTISGGTKINVVPDSCIVEIDRRTIPGETAYSVVSQIRKILKKLKINADVKVENSRMPMQISEKSEIVKLLKEITHARTSASTGYMESEMYYKAGIPCVNYGPGVDSQAHVANEYVPIKNLRIATASYEKMIRRLCM